MGFFYLKESLKIKYSLLLRGVLKVTRKKRDLDIKTKLLILDLYVYSYTCSSTKCAANRDLLNKIKWNFKTHFKFDMYNHLYSLILQVMDTKTIKDCWSSKELLRQGLRYRILMVIGKILILKPCSENITEIWCKYDAYREGNKHYDT